MAQRKLSSAERRLKLSPNFSTRYVIKLTQKECREMEGTNPKAIQRQSSDLELAQEATLSWEKNVMDQRRTDGQLERRLLWNNITTVRAACRTYKMDLCNETKAS